MLNKYNEFTDKYAYILLLITAMFGVPFTLVEVTSITLLAYILVVTSVIGFSGVWGMWVKCIPPKSRKDSCSEEA